MTNTTSALALTAMADSMRFMWFSMLGITAVTLAAAWLRSKLFPGKEENDA